MINRLGFSSVMVSSKRGSHNLPAKEVEFVLGYDTECKPGSIIQKNSDNKTFFVKQIAENQIKCIEIDPFKIKSFSASDLGTDIKTIGRTNLIA